MDVAALFLERVSISLKRRDAKGTVTIDRPAGGRKNEDAYLQSWLTLKKGGTKYVQPELNVTEISLKPSKFSRCLQLADLVTGSTLSFVSGEAHYSPTIFEGVQKLLLEASGRVGGVGLKIHPDAKYGGLYGSLLNEPNWKSDVTSLPLFDGPYKYSFKEWLMLMQQYSNGR